LTVLDRLRTRLESVLAALGTRLAKFETSPMSWTIMGLAISLLAALAYSTGEFGGELLGGVLVLVSGWFDIIDGAVARATERVSVRGGFLDSTLDRVGEVALFAGILFGAYTTPLAVLLALSLSLLVSYTRAKGDALGIKLAGVGIGERSERLLILAVSSLVGFVGWGVVAVAIVAGFTFIERTYTALLALKPTPEPKAISTET
jgi:archaetidylinositol phosphate synthase